MPEAVVVSFARTPVADAFKGSLAQTPIVEMFPFSPASRALERIAERLFEEPVRSRVGGGLKFMWQRLLTEAAANG